MDFFLGDGTAANEQVFTPAQIEDFQNFFKTGDYTKINTSQGEVYSVEGLTPVEKGQLLQTVIDGLVPLSWVYVPPGEYDNDLDHTLKIEGVREICVFGNGRSDVIIKNTHGFHAVYMNGGPSTIYRCTLRNFAITTGTPGTVANTADAIHLTGNLVSAIDIRNVQIQAAGRHGVFIGDNVQSCNISVQLTDSDLVTSNGILGDTVHMLSGHRVEIKNGRGHKYYFGANCNNGVVYEDYKRGSGIESITDLGSNNKVVALGQELTATRESDKSKLIPINGYDLPVYSSLAYFPFKGDSLNHAPTNYKSNLVIGTENYVNDQVHGKVFEFDGNSYFNIPNSANKTHSSFFLAFAIKIPTGQIDDNNKFMRNGNIEVQVSGPNLNLSATFDSFGTITGGMTIIPDVFQYYFIGYDGTVLRRGEFLTDNIVEVNIGTDTLSTGSIGFDIGRRLGNYFHGFCASWMFFDNYSPDYEKSFYNMMMKSKSQHLGVDRLGRNKMEAPFNLANYTNANRPASADDIGAVIFNTDDGQMNIWNGTNWTLSDGSII